MGPTKNHAPEALATGGPTPSALPTPVPAEMRARHQRPKQRLSPLADSLAAKLHRQAADENQQNHNHETCWNLPRCFQETVALELQANLSVVWRNLSAIRSAPGSIVGPLRCRAPTTRRLRRFTPLQATAMSSSCIALDALLVGCLLVSVHLFPRGRSR